MYGGWIREMGIGDHGSKGKSREELAAYPENSPTTD
jgi:hypothetical protein